MFGFSAGEILLIMVIAIILFGNDKLPQNIKKMLKSWQNLKAVLFQVQRSWLEVKYDLQKDLDQLDLNGSKINDDKKSIVIKPIQNIVSQEEIDLEQEKIHKIEESYKGSSS